MTIKNNIAALFDFDGVVMNTEHYYSVFWRSIGEKYNLGIDDFELQIKGQTLVNIFGKYFDGMTEAQKDITEGLDRTEAAMPYEYVPGVVDFIREIRSRGVKTALVTSSNRHKMSSVYRTDPQPELQTLFDDILTAERFTKSKPDPQPYLLGAESCGATPGNSVVFEDSFNGLISGRTAGMTVIGLATTYPEEVIKDMADYVIPDFSGYTYKKLMTILPRQ